MWLYRKKQRIIIDADWCVNANAYTIDTDGVSREAGAKPIGESPIRSSTVKLDHLSREVKFGFRSGC